MKFAIGTWGATGFGLWMALALGGCGGSVIGIEPVGDDGGAPDAGPGDDSGVSPPPGCPARANVRSGTGCRSAGLTCPSNVAVENCGGGSTVVGCTCDGASWQCEAIAEPDCIAPPPACPNPAVIVPGGGCNVAFDQTCTSTNVTVRGCNGGPPSVTQGTCTCASSGWSCPVLSVPCVSPPPPPPPTCPGPAQVFAYQPCRGDGLSCPGNPQVCDGAVFYDALECAGQQWIPIAETVCEADVVDASVGEDASPPIYDHHPPR